MRLKNKIQDFVKRNLNRKYAILSSIGVILLGIIIYGVVSIFALDESTWRIGQGENTALITGVGDKVVITSSAVTLDKDNIWLGLDWNYKKNLEIKNINNVILPKDDTITISVNTSALEEVQDSCNDLRVGYIEEGNLREIPRNIVLGSGSTNCNDSKDTKVSFKLQNELTNSTVEGYVEGDEYDSSYVIFYGNSTVGEPLFSREKYVSLDGTQLVKFDYDIPAFTSLSLGTWFRTEDLNGGVLTNYYNSSTYSHNLFIQNGYLKFCLGTSTSSCGSTTELVSTDIQVNDGVWHHVAVTWDGSNVSMYLDGNLSGSSPRTGNMLPGWLKYNHLGFVGYSASGIATIQGVGYLTGDFDDTFFFNRALNQEEVTRIYSDGVDTSMTPYSYYNFNNVSTQTISDDSGNSRVAFMGVNSTVEAYDPKVIVKTAYDISELSPTLLCPLGGSTTCLNNVTPSTATGAIKYNSGGSALSFDGFNDYIRTPDLTLDEFTFSTWVKNYHRGAPEDGNYQNLTQGTGIFTYISIREGIFRVYDGAGWRNTGVTIPNGEWGHVTLSFRGSDKLLKLYVNGTLSYSSSGLGTYTNGVLTGLGRMPSNVRKLLGSLDYVRVDNKVLSDAEIANIYNGGNPQLIGPSDSTLLLYYLDENGLDSRLSSIKTSLQTTFGVTGNYVAYDASGNNNHGLVVGAQYTNDTPLGDSGVMSNEGVLIEEGTTNKVLNPSFENTQYDKFWSKGYENVNMSAATFVAKMAKRNTAGPFGAGVTAQGKDVLTVPSGTLISNLFHQNMDHNQGSIAFWITPSWNGNDGQIHHIYTGNGIGISKWSDNNIYVRGGSTGTYLGHVPVNTWTAGTTYNVVVSWDTKNTINGTHYIRVSLNGVNSYIRTTALPTLTNSDYQLGGDAVIEGLTVYRRVLFDGTYGVNVGNGNEISQIYNSGTGKDPAEITGSWDIVFALPTDGTVGELTSTNQAWSMPHSTNLLGTGGFLMNSNYSTDGFNKYSNNQLLNSSFENNLDNWNYTQEYILRDEFNDTLPATLATGGVSNPVPVLGGELVTNGGMELGDPPSGWTYPANITASQVLDERSGGLGSFALSMVNSSGQGYARQTLTGTTVGTWYRLSGWFKPVSSSGVLNLLNNSNSAYTSTNYIYSGGWQQFNTVISRAPTNDIRVSLWHNTVTGSTESRWDDITVKPLTLSSLFSSVSVPSSTDYTVQSNVTLTSGTQAGVVVSLDSDTNPNNFVIAYHDGTTAKLEKNVNGTYTTLVNVGTTYVAGAPIKVVKNNNSYTMFYNNNIVGTTQTINDASIINNTRHGVFSTYESNSFTNFEVKGGVNGTLATDGVSSRLIKDSYSKLNISNNSLNFEAGALASTGIHYSAIERLVGRILYTKFTWDSGQEGRITWDDNTGIGSATHNFGFYNGAISGYGSSPYNPSLGPALQSGVEYEVSIILKDAGAYYFIRGGIYPNWTLLGYAGTFSSGPLYPSVYTTSTPLFVASFETISVPGFPYIPTPLVYDTFTRTNGSVGSTEVLGPDGQTTNSLSWDKGEVVDNKLKITPTLGSELVINGGMEEGNPPNDWTAFSTPDVFERSSVDKNSGTYSSRIVSATSDKGLRSSNMAIEVGKWYTANTSYKTISASFRWSMSGYFNKTKTSSTWAQDTATFRSTGTSSYIFAYVQGVNGEFYMDDASLKPLDLNSLFSTVSTPSKDIIMDTNVTIDSNLGTQAGLVMNLDDKDNPQNFVIAYRDGTNIKLDKSVNGVYTNVQTTASTYVAGAPLRVIKDGTKYRVYYNNALVGSEQTITDGSIINNTRHGIFSTHESNTFDNFTIFPRGTNGEYNDIPAEDLTAYRDTSITYNGVSSVKLISGGNHAPFTQTKTLQNSTYEVSTYVYKDGNAVTSSDIEIYYNSNPVASTYENVGSGWYRVYGNITGTGTSTEVGVQVKANRSLNVDKLELQILGDQITVGNISANNKIFNSGYTINSDTGSGLYKDVNITTGQDIVIRGIANSDGTSVPKLSVYDLTNDIEIGYLLGTNTSTKSTPDNLIFTAEGTHASKSTGTVTLTTNPIDGDLLEIGGVIYEFKDDISNPLVSDIYIKIGADSTETSNNLVSGIMGTAGLNTTYSYGTGSVAHTGINATNTNNVLNIESKTTGKINNNITLSEVGNSITISNTSLINGRDNSSVLRIRLLNNSNTISNVNWHQVEVYNNLIDNPSFERWDNTTNIPSNWNAYGTFTNTDLVSGGGSFTGGNSLGLTTQYYGKYLRQDKASAGRYIGAGAIGYGDGSQVIRFGPGSGGSSWYQYSTTSNMSNKLFSPEISWRRIAGVVNKGTGGTASLLIFPSNTGNSTRYVDDVYWVSLSDVPLTITPSNLTDSTTNDGGVIVNGRDTLSIPLNMSNPNNGVIRFDYTPTWNNPTVHTMTHYIFDTDTNARILLYSSGTYQFNINGTQVALSGVTFTAGQRYSIEVSYNAGGTTYLKVDGNIVASTTAFNGFTTTGPTTLHLGSRYSGESTIDGTFHPYTSSTVSSNTDMSYVKYGSKSTRILTTTSTDEYLTELNLGTNHHHLSAYVYNNTTGSIGGTIDSSVVQLVFNNVPVTTTYTDQGGGWWRLHYRGTGVSGTQKYGLQVKANKNVYIDGVMVNELPSIYHTGLSRYFDGDLGSGYTWSGIADESTSVRTGGSLQYSNVPINTTNNTVSFWMKLERPLSEVSYTTLFSISGYSMVRNSGHNANQIAFFTSGSDVRYNPGFNNTDWYYITITDSPSENPKFYVNGVLQTNVVYSSGTVPDSVYTAPATLSIGASSSSISDFRIYNDTLSTDQITQLYNQGMNTYSVGDSSNGKYATEGTWTSQVIDLGNNGQWGMSPSLTITDNKGDDNILYKTRTSPDNSNWSEYQIVSAVEGGFNFSSPANRYMQVEATLQSSDQTTTPSFSGMQFNYVMDTIKPSVNASEVRYYNQVEGGELQTPNDWTKYDSPYISWTAGADDVDGSGLRGYCLYLGQDINADPANDSGLLSTTSPVHTSDTNCEFIIGTNSIDFSNLDYRGETWMTSSNSPYYLKIKAVDMTGNVFGADETDAHVYTFKLDNTKPNNPKGISAPQSYQREITSFRIFWADTGSSMATDTHSGVKGYQYRIGETGTWYGAGHTGDQSCDDLITTNSYTLQEQFEGEEFGDELNIGSNVFYLRTWDNICNVTETYATAILQYSADAPSAPTSLSVTPETNELNQFAFSWSAPDTFSGQAGGITYCYTINSFPSSPRCNWTQSTNLSADSYANQPGENIIYVVARDEAGNVNYGDYANIKFYANTSAPGMVQNLEISDVSIKSTERWRLALSWEIPQEMGAGVASYRVYRSTTPDSNYSNDPSVFTQVGTTSGESFTDVNLTPSIQYYSVRACDSANNCSAGSNTVSMLPSGRYYSPANIITQPVISKLSTRSATITWITERESDSKIAFGLNPGEYFEEEISNSNQVVEHTLTLNNLTAGTTYYYTAKWTDEDGNTGQTDELSFKTEPPPSVKDVGISYVNLDGAGIKFTAKGASKVKIYYGKSASLGNSLELETSPVETSYTMALTGLDDGTKYLYKVNLFDVDSNEYDGTVLLDFSTPPRPKITDVQLQEKTGTAQPTIEVTWESNTEVNSVIRFYPEGREDLAQNRVDIEMIKGTHSLLLNGLLPTTKYVLRVEGTDKYGNTGTSEPYSFTTATDTRPPEIYDVRVDQSILSNEVQPDRTRSAQIVVSWKTDEPATSQVEYDSGLGDSYSQKSNVEPNLKMDHVVVINNLSPSTVYHIRAVSNDVAQNIGIGTKMVAVTPKATNTVFEVVAESLGNIFKFLR